MDYFQLWRLESEIELTNQNTKVLTRLHSALDVLEENLLTFPSI